MAEVYETFRMAPPEAIVRGYRALLDAAKVPPPGGPHPCRAELLRRQTAALARTRGFLAATGELDPACLQGCLTPDQEEELRYDRNFKSKEKGEVDISPIAFDPELASYNAVMTMARRLRQLDRFVLDAILARIQDLRRRFFRDRALQGALGFATYLVKVSRGIVQYRKNPGTTPAPRKIHREEGTPRQFLVPLRLWRNAPDGPARMVNREKDTAPRAKILSASSTQSPALPPAARIRRQDEGHTF
jgi:hypothetical protein